MVYGIGGGSGGFRRSKAGLISHDLLGNFVGEGSAAPRLCEAIFAEVGDGRWSARLRSKRARTSACPGAFPGRRSIGYQIDPADEALIRDQRKVRALATHPNSGPSAKAGGSRDPA